MKIIDTNILNKIVRNEVKGIDLSQDFYITEDLGIELENLKSISDDFKNILSKINFKDIKECSYFENQFNEADFLKNYKIYINKYNTLISFYGLKSIADVSIIALVKTALNHPVSLFNQLSIEVITHDSGLKSALQNEFGEKIIITDPLENT